MIDIDFFKKVNDSYGHIAGDAVLKDVALLITKSCRNLDIVSRNGGKEFSVILINCSINKALEIGERIRIAIQSNPFIMLDEKEIRITVSIGVSTYLDNTVDVDKLMDQADHALYTVLKDAGFVTPYLPASFYLWR